MKRVLLMLLRVKPIPYHFKTQSCDLLSRSLTHLCYYINILSTSFFIRLVRCDITEGISTKPGTNSLREKMLRSILIFIIIGRLCKLYVQSQIIHHISSNTLNRGKKIRRMTHHRRKALFQLLHSTLRQFIPLRSG